MAKALVATCALSMSSALYVPERVNATGCAGLGSGASTLACLGANSVARESSGTPRAVPKLPTPAGSGTEGGVGVTGSVQRVARFGPVEREDPHASPLLDEQYRIICRI